MSVWRNVGFNITLSPGGDRVEVYEDGILASVAKLWHPIRIQHDGDTFKLKVGVSYMMEGNNDGDDTE